MCRISVLSPLWLNAPSLIALLYAFNAAAICLRRFVHHSMTRLSPYLPCHVASQDSQYGGSAYILQTLYRSNISSRQASTSSAGTCQSETPYGYSQQRTSHWYPVPTWVATIAVESRNRAPSKPRTIVEPSATFCGRASPLNASRSNALREV